MKRAATSKPERASKLRCLEFLANLNEEENEDQFDEGPREVPADSGVADESTIRIVRVWSLADENAKEDKLDNNLNEQLSTDLKSNKNNETAHSGDVEDEDRNSGDDQSTIRIVKVWCMAKKDKRSRRRKRRQD